MHLLFWPWYFKTVTGTHWSVS